MKKLFIQLSVSENLKKHLAIFFLYALLALALLSPTGSREFIPSHQDARTHIAAIIQAHAAMQEGQFPVRTTPIEYNGWGYPKFQFYSPTLYFFSNLLYSILPTATDTPYLIVKIFLFLSFWLGGFFLYRLSLFFTHHFSASALAGFAYMASPYFLIDAHWRYALAETINLGLIPITLYYSIRLYLNKNFSFKDWLLASILWYGLMTIHLITFVNTSVFAALFILLLQCNKNVISLWRIATAYLWACVLGAWFLIPVILDSNLFYITLHVSDKLMTFNWLTSLQRLLSITSFTSSYNFPGKTNNYLAAVFYPAVGWPLLIGFTTCFFGIFSDTFHSQKSLMIKLMSIFLIALFMAWSPVDFWQYLPQVLNISQYTYRLLTEVIWAGALLTGLAFSIILPRKTSNWFIIPLGIWIIGLSSASWLTSPLNDAIDISTVMKNPDLGYHHAETNYLVDPKAQVNPTVKIPAISVQKTQTFCRRIQGGMIHCYLPSSFSGGITPFPVLYYPHLLAVSVDHQSYDYFSTYYNEKFLLVGLSLAPGPHIITFEFTGIHWANEISALTLMLSFIGLILLMCINMKR